MTELLRSQEREEKGKAKNSGPMFDWEDPRWEQSESSEGTYCVVVVTLVRLPSCLLRSLVQIQFPLSERSERHPRPRKPTRFINW